MFCDLRGFTAFAETAEPEDIMAVLAEYHGAVGPLIRKHEGTLDRFTGDGMMVFFNDPLPCPDPAARAAQAGARDARRGGAARAGLDASAATAWASASASRRATPRWAASASRVASTTRRSARW